VDRALKSCDAIFDDFRAAVLANCANLFSSILEMTRLHHGESEIHYTNSIDVGGIFFQFLRTVITFQEVLAVQRCLLMTACNIYR
jgi:hypothetical protein